MGKSNLQTLIDLGVNLKKCKKKLEILSQKLLDEQGQIEEILLAIAEASQNTQS